MEPSSDDQQLSFLDFDSCSIEDKNLLFNILKLEVPGRVEAPPPPPTPKSVSSIAAPVPISEYEPAYHPQQQQQPQQPQPTYHPGYDNPPNVSEYSSTLPQNTNHSFSSYNTSATPCVYINQVTANVNVHHGPASHHLHDDHHQHHPPAPPQLMQQRFPSQGPPPPIPGYPVAPQPSMLPTPQFGMPPHSTGFVAPPFVTNPAMMSKPTMPPHSMYPMHHPGVMSGYYMAPFYGYQMVTPSGLTQAPPQHAPALTRPLLRGNVPPISAPPLYPPNPMTDLSVSFPAPPPLPAVCAGPVSNAMPPPPPPDFIPEVSVLQPPPSLLPPPAQVEVLANGGDDVGRPFNAVDQRVDDDEDEPEVVPENGDDGCEKSDAGSFGFEVPDEVIVVESGVEVSDPVEEVHVREDIPTPVQDENDDDVADEQQVSPVPEQVPDVQEPRAAAAAAPKSWASLFHSESKSSQDGSRSAKPTATIHPYTGDLSDKSGLAGAGYGKGDLAGPVSLGRREAEMAAFLRTYALNHKAQSLKPRGLSNRSNWCFVNAIMQALVACPPFFNLIKALPDELLRSDSADILNSPLKMMASVNSFMSEFGPLENFPRMNRKSKKQEDLPLGKTFEAATIFNVLLNLNSDTFKVIEGRQEDAEEFLTYLLNCLNDEMISVLKLLGNGEDEDKNGSAANPNANANTSSNSNDGFVDDDDDFSWQEVGPKNKSCATRRGAGFKTPLADIFQGQIRSCVTRSVGDATATLQTFFTLQLDIQSDGIKNVSDALAHNFTVEPLDGYVCPKTKQEIEASRSLQLEELPPVLVLHLKRFIYNGTSVGCQKLLKNIDFPVDLDISKEILSPNTRNKYAPRQRQYKLFAVVYHNGTEATKGHYVADVYHSGLSTWLHCDDSILKPMSETMVTAHSASSMPYILFYRRGDTMGGGPSGPEKAKEKLGPKSSLSAAPSQ